MRAEYFCLHFLLSFAKKRQVNQLMDVYKKLSWFFKQEKKLTLQVLVF